MEEVDLRGIKSSRPSRDAEVNRRNHTDSSLSGDFVGLDLASKLMDGGVSKDEGYFLLE